MTKSGAILGLFAASLVGVILLTRHDNAVKDMMRTSGLAYGCDWVWADISECSPFWVAQPKSAATGEVLRVPFMGGIR